MTNSQNKSSRKAGPPWSTYTDVVSDLGTHLSTRWGGVLKSSTYATIRSGGSGEGTLAWSFDFLSAMASGGLTIDCGAVSLRGQI